MSRRARILFYCKLLRIGIYSIRLTPQMMSEPFQIWFRHVWNNLFAGTGNTLYCMPDSAYRHSGELHRMVRNGYSVSIQWVVKTVQCSLPIWVIVILVYLSYREKPEKVNMEVSLLEKKQRCSCTCYCHPYILCTVPLAKKNTWGWRPLLGTAIQVPSEFKYILYIPTY